jgi:hypothetical protein
VGGSHGVSIATTVSDHHDRRLDERPDCRSLPRISGRVAGESGGEAAAIRLPTLDVVPAQPDVFSADADYVKSRVADGRTVIASTCDVAFRKRLSGWKS